MQAAGIVCAMKKVKDELKKKKIKYLHWLPYHEYVGEGCYGGVQRPPVQIWNLAAPH